MGTLARLSVLQGLVVTWAWACSGTGATSHPDGGLGGWTTVTVSRDAGGGHDAGDASARDAGSGGQGGMGGGPDYPADADPPLFVCPKDASADCLQPSPSFAEVSPLLDKYCGGSCHEMTYYPNVHSIRAQISVQLNGCGMLLTSSAITLDEWYRLVNWLNCGAPLDGGMPVDLDASPDAPDSSELDGGGPADASGE